MTDKNAPSISRRDLLRISGLGIGGLGFLTAGCTNTLHTQTAFPVPEQPATQTPLRVGIPHVVITDENPALERDRSLCTRCGHCLDYCYRYMTVQGHRSSEGRLSCIYCGQCSIRCEPRSITERSDIAEFQSALADPNTIVVTTTAPAVRAALGEMFPMPSGSYVEDKMVAALKQLGCNYVFDTTFGADLTIMEEASELLHRLEHNVDAKYPLFTSCCPAWVRFAELFTPEIVPYISTAKSPILMQGATIKTYFAQKNGLDPKRIFNVAITPCTAKKAEIKRHGSNTLADQPGYEGLSEVDLVLTVRELGKLLQEKKIDFPKLTGASFDSLMGRGSGAGISFGRSGGVMESALRTAYYLVNNENAPLQKDVELRGEMHTVNWVYPMALSRIAGVRQDTVNLGERSIRIAVVETPGSLRSLLDAIEHDGERFDFVEVMACQGGCLGGGGQPYPAHWGATMQLAYDRRLSLQSGVDRSEVRWSHENGEVALVYQEFFGAPLGEKSKALLHTKTVP